MIGENPVFAQLMAAAALHPESGAWASFMDHQIRLPRYLGPVVVQTIRLGRWKFTDDPLEAVRSEAIQAYERAWGSKRAA